MIDFKPLLRTILDGYTLPWNGIHGVGHWARVHANGARLAEATGARLEVVRLFAIFHDSRRVNEREDKGHGRRGADLAAKLHGDLFDLSDDDFELLRFACTHHTDGMTEGDITVQTCWDADRLDLARVGMVTEPGKLGTDAARTMKMLVWAERRAVFEIIPDFVSAEWEIALPDDDDHG